MQRENAAALMGDVVRQLREAAALHFVAMVETNFGVLEFANIRLGPFILEAWYKHPQWRLDMSVGEYRGIVISTGEPEIHGDYAFKNGQWVRTRARISDRPDFKLELFRLTDFARCSRASLEEGVLDNEPVWIIQGMEDNERTSSWWVRKQDLAVRQVKVEGGHFEFEHAGVKKRGQIPGAFTLRVETIEFNVTIRDALFQVPSDVAVEEEPEEEPDDWFDNLEQVLGMISHGINT